MESDGEAVRELARKFKERGGVHTRDLPPNAELKVTVGGQVVFIWFGEQPESGLVVISSGGPQWTIWAHLTDNWGCCAGADATTMSDHWLSAGCRLNVGRFTFPEVEKIIFQGLDLADPAAGQLQ